MLPTSVEGSSELPDVVGISTVVFLRGSGQPEMTLPTLILLAFLPGGGSVVQKQRQRLVPHVPQADQRGGVIVW